MSDAERKARQLADWLSLPARPHPMRGYVLITKGERRSSSVGKSNDSGWRGGGGGGGGDSSDACVDHVR